MQESSSCLFVLQSRCFVFGSSLSRTTTVFCSSGSSLSAGTFSSVLHCTGHHIVFFVHCDRCFFGSSLCRTTTWADVHCQLYFFIVQGLRFLLLLFFPKQTRRTKLLCLFFIVTDAFSSSEVFPVLCVYEPRSSRSLTSRELHNGALVYHEYNEYCSMKFYHSFRILRHQCHGRPRFERTNTEH